MLRTARWLLGFAILAITAFTIRTYMHAKRVQNRTQPKAHEALPENIAASFKKGWTWERKDGDQLSVRVRAESIEMIKEPSNYQLRGVEIELHKKDKPKYDLVKSAQASFDTAAGTMFSEGEVEITMGLADEGTPAGRIVKIKSSGVTFETKTNRAITDKHVVFELDAGDGEADGAVYDSTIRELVLSSNVKLNWHGTKKSPRVMHLESGDLVYKEKDAAILLGPWAKLTRENFSMESGKALVFLKEGEIERVEAQEAKGRDEQPNRQVEYAAANLFMRFAEKGHVERVEGRDGSRVVSTSATATTTMTAKSMDLDFEAGENESTLKKALGYGAARVESKPIVKPGQQPPDTRVLSSEIVDLKMRSGGKDIEQVETQAPGVLEFLPNRPGQKKRRLDAERMTMVYAADNRLDSFRATAVKTRTEGESKGKPVITLTSSRNLSAKFDPKTGQLGLLEQWDDFTYEEGTRKAKADRARMDQTTDIVTLTRNARVWDETGSTQADEIVVDQKENSTVARGNVASTRLPDKKKSESGTGLLSNDEPMQARARTMVMTDNNRKIRYEGGAVLWQGARRLTADTVLIDKVNKRLEANGKVVTQMPDTEQPEQGKPKKGNGYSVVRAPDMAYDDNQKLAVYWGGATLERQGLEVKSSQLRAFFREVEDASKNTTETQLDKLLADGQVDIFERLPDRTRHSTGDHGEHYLQDDKMLLTGGPAVMIDSKQGIMRGQTLTWFSREDRLIVDNTGSGPAVSRITKKK